MCGVFGFVSYDGKGPDLKRLEAVAAVTEERGPHAFGFAWVDWAGRLQMFKQTGKITHHLSKLALARNARMLIGHCRWATHGDFRNNLNNHPHPADSGWIVHNGQIRDYRSIAEVNDLHLTTECDSEVLGLLFGALEGNHRERSAEVVKAAKCSPFALLGLWSRPARLIALRAGNPLTISECQGGQRFYLGSYSRSLPATHLDVPNGTGVEFTPKRMVQFDLPYVAPKPNPSPKPPPARSRFRDGSGSLFN
jgi:glucosamine 6-phosphate synthetase-like amidotransferase/phosphosugar isomerase protein